VPTAGLAVATPVEASQDNLVSRRSNGPYAPGGQLALERTPARPDNLCPQMFPQMFLKAFGKEYFDLLKNNPDLGAVFALDGRILVMVGGQAFQVEVE
jgi:hypothetical protein